METRVCNKCGIERDLDKENFAHYKSTTGKVLLRLYCRECHRKQINLNYHENIEESRKIRKEYHSKMKNDPAYIEKRKKSSAEWSNKNIERVKKNRENWVKNNPDYGKKWYKENSKRHKKLMKLFYKNNPGYNTNYEKEKMGNDPLYKFSKRIRTNIREALRKKGWAKTTGTQELLGADFETVKSYIEKQFIKGMTWDNHGEWHFDHIIPINSANTIEEMIPLFHYVNLQPMWASENISKSDDFDPKEKEKYLEWYSKNVVKK